MSDILRRVWHRELLASPVTSMDFESLTAAEAGDIEILVLEALPGTELEGLVTESCLCYVVLNFLLCVPAGAVAEPALTAAAEEGHTGLIGPAHRISARAVSLGETGEWVMSDVPPGLGSRRFPGPHASDRRLGRSLQLLGGRRKRLRRQGCLGLRDSSGGGRPLRGSRQVRQ